MARPNAWRALVFAVMCILSPVGVWLAYSVGRTALGAIGGVLVALVAALMLGALVFIFGLLLLKPIRPQPRTPAESTRPQW